MKLPVQHLKDFEPPVKHLFSGYLTVIAVGYFFALVQILFTHGMADGEFGLSIDDIVYSYYGNRSGTVLEKKLNGSMKDNATEQQRFLIMKWVRDGAEQSDFESSGVKKVIESRCVMCHNEGATAIPDFTKFEPLKEMTTEDGGATFASLIRVSHIHLFGIGFIFMLVGFIFTFAETPTSKYMSLAIGMPYLFLLIDILSWWLTKISPMFAWLVIIAGTGMGISFVFMWVVSILEMWMFNTVFIDKSGKTRRPLSEVVEEKLKSSGFLDASESVFSSCVRCSKQATFYLWEKAKKIPPMIAKWLDKSS